MMRTSRPHGNTGNRHAAKPAARKRSVRVWPYFGESEWSAIERRALDANVTEGDRASAGNVSRATERATRPGRSQPSVGGDHPPSTNYFSLHSII